MEKSWDFPKKGFVKINIHAMSLNEAPPNGNTSGIGIVMRDNEGIIIKMISGSIRNLTERGNELWSFLVALRSAFYEKENNIQLESDNAKAVKEWLDWRWFIDPNHSRIIQQLEQRKKDHNLNMEIKVIQASQNQLTRYLARDGAANRTRVVVFRHSFGRVKEYWMQDMGLGAVEARFQELEENEFQALLNQEVEVDEAGVDEDSDEEALWLVEGLDMPNMGQIPEVD